jgi:magnesium transporter
LLRGSGALPTFGAPGGLLLVEIQHAFLVQNADDLVDRGRIAFHDHHGAAADHALGIGMGIRSRDAQILQERREVVRGGPNVDVVGRNAGLLQVARSGGRVMLAMEEGCDGLGHRFDPLQAASQCTTSHPDPPPARIGACGAARARYIMATSGTVMRWIVMANPLKLVSAQPKGMPGVVASAVYAGGRRVLEIPIEEAGEWSRKPGHVVWIGLHEPGLDLLRRVQAEFGLHELAIEDALKAHQRPKIEQYGDALFVVARTAQMVEGRIAFGETHLFVGRGYVVSVRHGASTTYTPVRERCEAAPKALSEGEDFILYAILDFIVDNYMPVIETIQEEVEEIEDSILTANQPQNQIVRLYQLRRDLLRLRNAAVPLVEVCRRLEQPGMPGVDAAMQPLFRDVSDHIRRVQEEIESLREVLAFAFESSLMTGQSQQNEITRKLAAWAAILAVPTAVAGIYGMNFDVLPELHWKYGYPFVLTIIVLTCTWLYWRFRRKQWL